MSRYNTIVLDCGNEKTLNAKETMSNDVEKPCRYMSNLYSVCACSGIYNELCSSVARHATLLHRSFISVK